MALIDDLNPYAYAMRFRRLAYRRGWIRSYSAGLPVISVGNLSVGGSGKSPLVLLVAEYLERKGKRVAIVSRGYKRTSNGLVVVRNGGDILVPVEVSGDEPQMVAELLPNVILLVDEDRVRGAGTAKELGADVIILDDGFQHLRLKRELNILLTNGEVSPVLPFGRAREPQSAMKDATLVVSADEKDAEIQIKSIPKELRSLEGEIISLESVVQKRVVALSSIAKPERFQNMLKELGSIVTPFALPDHAAYSTELGKKIIHSAKDGHAELIVTTMKDAVKSRKYFEHVSSPIPILILLHQFEFLRGKERFFDAIDRIL